MLQRVIPGCNEVGLRRAIAIVDGSSNPLAQFRAVCINTREDVKGLDSSVLSTGGLMITDAAGSLPHISIPPSFSFS